MDSHSNPSNPAEFIGGFLSLATQEMVEGGRTLTDTNRS